MATVREVEECEALLEDIEAQEKTLWALTLDMNTKKLALKESKEAFDAGVAELRRLARTRIGDEYPLFDNKESDE